MLVSGGVFLLLHLNPFKSILLHGIFHDLGHLFVGWDLILLLVLLQASDDPRAICNVIFQIRDTPKCTEKMDRLTTQNTA